ncbi:MAG: DUF1844 domain-containing protein [Candidatus Omnitrophota bacterium]|nr:DUF1844 domain-containing protein [Candidatus Omnitrophota bacterium]
MNEEIRKKVDDNWKSQVEKEKDHAQEKKEPYHQPTFTIFLSSISMQAMIALGRIENPVTGKKEESKEQSRFLIDTLGIIKEKTKGNLTPEEQTLLDDSLFNLRMMYVEDKEKK